MSILRFALILGLVAFFAPAAHPQIPPVAADQPPLVSPPNWSDLSALQIGAPKNGPELILNGDFETTSFLGCDFNQSNASFTNGMANATGFGAASQIDVMVSPTGCSYLLAPTSGSVKVGICSQTSAGNVVDAFSLHLSEALNAGESYTLSFDAIAYAQGFAPDIGDVLIGVSTVPSAFGTLVYSATPQAMNWQTFGTTFVAPNNGQYLTVKQELFGISWNHLDSFSLTAECAPSVVYCTPKLNSLGCSPTIFTTGTPSLGGSGQAFRIWSGGVLNQKVGLLIWGRAPASTPFAGGTQCVAPPLIRTAAQHSGGSSLPAMDCDGLYSFQFSPAMMNQAGLVVGDDVYSQYWSRDNGFLPPNNVGLTAGIHWEVCP